MAAISGNNGFAFGVSSRKKKAKGIDVMKQTVLASFYLSLAAGIWGGMYVVSKYVLDYIPPFTDPRARKPTPLGVG
ncbi:Permease of the drug/metabolite transporter (DMT) superfamily [Geobacillus proteiniphilus]|uniref:Permease of the drug/metabolite transporter (DMT) superfamily n=1 Tax=Geobacillus proteiniphilus TaxID=860353 RepID=A0A1Q5SV89_9BACL|nr:Permease of the drug/metabolite transporter (DMT) superfamily [Geobacillus proteiniphilus]